MTEIERKALALIAEIKTERGIPAPDYLSARAALIRAIEQHEAFRQEVSDAVEEVMRIATKANFACERGPAILEVVSHFILPKPDPLVEALDDIKDGRAGPTTESYAACLRAAIEKRGGKLVWGEG